MPLRDEMGPASVLRKSMWLGAGESRRWFTGRGGRVNPKRSRVYQLVLTTYHHESVRVAWVVRLKDKYLVRVTHKKEHCPGGARVVPEWGRFLLALPRGGPDKVEISTCYTGRNCQSGGPSKP